MALFDRTYRLVIGRGGQTGLEITENRIVFNISKTSEKTPNSSDFRIWGLRRETREQLERTGTRCVLYAGYVEQDGPLKMFEGEVTFAWTSFDGPEVVTKFELGEGVSSYRDTAVSLSYPGGAGSRQVLQDIAGQMGLGLDVAPDAMLRTWQNGLSFHGPARHALDRVTRATGLSWSIQGGAVQVTRAGGATARRAIVLAGDSGLIASPERERKGAQQTARVRNQDTQESVRVASTSKAYDGWRTKSLLMPTILPGDPVKLESRSAEGVFVAREVQHRGDSEGGDWTTELLLVDAATQARLQRQERGTTGQQRPTPPPVRTGAAS